MKVNVSTLRELEFCPRVVYLRDVLKVKSEPTPQQAIGLVGHAVRKELSMRQAKLVKKIKDDAQLATIIQEELDRIMADLPFIYREKLSGINLEEMISEIRREMDSELELVSSRLRHLVSEHGLKQALELVTPWKVEYPMSSDTMGFSGIVDKVMSPMIPVEIKTGRVGSGVWEGDKLQVCAYGMLLEEKFGQEILQGLVEYTRVQEQRPVLFTEILRRRVVDARDRVIEILSGCIPEICPHGNGRKCNACGLKETCYGI